MVRRLQDARFVLWILGLLGSSPALAEGAGRWIDPPSDRELLQMMASIPLPPHDGLVSTALPFAAGSLNGDDTAADPVTAMGREAALKQPGKPVSSMEEDAITGDEKVREPAPAPVKARKSPRPSRAAARGRSRKTTSQSDPFARLFGPPRRDSHVITTTHTR